MERHGVVPAVRCCRLLQAAVSWSWRQHASTVPAHQSTPADESRRQLTATAVTYYIDCDRYTLIYLD
jgi:hypothetical protein